MFIACNCKVKIYLNLLFVFIDNFLFLVIHKNLKKLRGKS